MTLPNDRTPTKHELFWHAFDLLESEDNIVEFFELVCFMKSRHKIGEDELRKIIAAENFRDKIAITYVGGKMYLLRK